MQVQQELERFTNDALFVEEHRAELLKKYPERWIAVYEREVVGTAREITALVQQLKRKGISAAHAYCAYLTDKDEILILNIQ